MRVFNDLAFVAAFVSLSFAFAVCADEPGALLTDPGYRPESDRSAEFIREVSSAKIAVFPTIIRTAGDTSYSVGSSQWAVEFLGLNMLGTGKTHDTPFDMGQLQGNSQWEMFEAGMTTIGGQLSDRNIQEDYAIVVEVLIPPPGPRTSYLSVFGVHCFVLEPDGTNAFSFLLNSHHQAFNDANLLTSDLTANGRTWLADASTKLALRALEAQIDRDPRSEIHDVAPGSPSLNTSVIDDFNSDLPTGTDSVGLPIGFFTFADATSAAKISATTSHPERQGEASGNQVLQVDLDLTGWAGLIHAFENEAMDSWVSNDWRAFLGFRFWLYGNNSGATLFVDVLDNREKYSTSDDAERYTYQFEDDFAGWQQVNVPFAKMVRKEIGNAAPSDGLDLMQVHGWAFGSSSSAGQLTYYIDDFELYGGRVSLPSEEPPQAASDSRWQVRETKEGRFRVLVSVRTGPPAGMESSDYPKLATFTWYYRAGMDGMSKDEKELFRILAWATRLDELLVAERVAFQLGTRGGAKRLRAYFYAADIEKLRELSLQAGERNIETEMDFGVSDDPDWEEWRKMGRPSDAEQRSSGSNVAGTPIPASVMDPILWFDGFYVRRPNDSRWRLEQNYRTPHIGMFSFAPLSPTHSFNAGVMVRGLPRDFVTKEEFKEFIDSKVRDADRRFELLSLASSMTELHGEWAVNYEVLFLDNSPVNAETPLHMSVKGVVFLHPLRDRMVIDAFYSERGTEDDLDGTLDPVGEELISGTIPAK